MAASQQAMLMASGGAAPLRLSLPFEGEDGSTTIPDVSAYGRTVTALGNAHISTAQARSGSSSLLLDGAGDGLLIADAVSLRPGTRDFRIEFAVRYASIANYITVLKKGYASTGALILQTIAGTGRLAVYSGPGSTNIVTEAGGALSLNTWYDVVVERVGSTVTVYRDGASGGSGTSSFDFTNGNDLYIGGGSGGGFDAYFLNGYLDNFNFYIY